MGFVVHSPERCPYNADPARCTAKKLQRQGNINSFIHDPLLETPAAQTPWLLSVYHQVFLPDQFH